MVNDIELLSEFVVIIMLRSAGVLSLFVIGALGTASEMVKKNFLSEKQIIPR